MSVATVFRALNDSSTVNDHTKHQIWKLAREHAYPFRGHMPGGPTKAAATLMVVVTRPQGRGAELTDPFFLELLAEIGEASRAAAISRSPTSLPPAMLSFPR